MSLFERLAASLGGDAPGLLSGDDALPVSGAVVSGAPMAAAVLVAVVDRAEPTLLLTVRMDTLRHHAGEVAFPGGRVDAGETVIAAALREANEEVGLDPANVRIVGCADAYGTITGFSVTPVIGIIPPDLPLVASDAEVAAVFEVPLTFAMNAANHHLRTIHWQGVPRTYFEIMWQDRRIWGATAAMIVNLSRRLERVS